ncbi:MAG: B3/4 domain-containing protein [Candidatus Bathyarchaeia archaeon]
MKSLQLTWDEEVVSWFPSLAVSAGIIRGVKVERTNAEAEKLRIIVFSEARSAFKLDELKNNNIVRAYRDLFWALDIDPTKTRPSGEALLRRVLHGKDIPQISSAVDAYNLASLQTIVPISGFDLDTVTPPLHVRFSEKGDVFQSIGVETAEQLDEKMLLVTDRSLVLCVYPHKDADATKITGKTQNILLIGYGAPSISEDTLVEAVSLALTYVHQVAGGRVEGVEVYSAKP